ncbi:MAG: hypothetical protein ABSA66_21635 [Roseiarcus sp.]|jgi:hypothetical protein
MLNVTNGALNKFGLPDNLVLPTRLTRPKRPTLFATVLGAVLAAMGAGLYWACTNVFTPAPPWLVTYVASGVLFVLGALLLLSVLFRVIVGSPPAPIIELSEQPFPRGRRIRITVIQPGPVDWRDFSVKLECLEETYKWGSRQRNDDNTLGESFRGTETSNVVRVLELLAPQSVQASRGTDWRQTLECVLPEDAPGTLKNRDDAVFWQVVMQGGNQLVSGFKDIHEVYVE